MEDIDMSDRPAVCVQCDSVELCKHDEGRTEHYTVELRHPDGRTKLHRNWLVPKEPGDDEVYRHVTWLYENGNWACDCNRVLDWHRSTATEEEMCDFMDLPCYGQTTYGVRIRNTEGVVVYEDNMDK